MVVGTNINAKRKTFLSILFVCVTRIVFAQEPVLNTKVYGLTCALCSRSVHKQLEKVAGIKDIIPDLENTSFIVKSNQINGFFLQEINNAIKRSGFTLGYIDIKLLDGNDELDKHKYLLLQSGKLFELEEASFCNSIKRSGTSGNVLRIYPEKLKKKTNIHSLFSCEVL